MNALANAVLSFQVDVIVSEWMGYTLLFETMLDTVLYARDRCHSVPSSHASRTFFVVSSLP